jgi:hypothetical protein
MADVIALRRGGVLPIAIWTYAAHHPDRLAQCVVCNGPVTACRARANAAKVLIACGLRPERFDRPAVTVTAARPEPFYLDGLLYCHAPMRPVTRRTRRRYECPVCRCSVDALAAEVEVWEQAHTARPDLGAGSTPYEHRAARLAAVLRWARLLANGRYTLRWHGAIGIRTSR